MAGILKIELWVNKQQFDQVFVPSDWTVLGIPGPARLMNGKGPVGGVTGLVACGYLLNPASTVVRATS